MLPVTSWPPVRPGFWSSPFGAPARVRPGQHREGFPLPKGCFLVHTGSNRVVMLIRPVDPNEPYWQTPGTGIVHGFPKPNRPTWPDEDWPRTGWPWAPSTAPAPPPSTPPSHWPWGKGTHKTCPPPPSPCPPTPCPPHGELFTLIGPCSTGTVFSDGQNVRLFGTGEATVIKVFSV